MNPHINSINGWGAGFIAFWPNQTGVEPPYEPKQVRYFYASVGKLMR